MHGWGLVISKLRKLGSQRWRQAIDEAKQGGCTPGMALSIIAHGEKTNANLGAIICRLSKARPTLPVEDGWMKGTR